MQRIRLQYHFPPLEDLLHNTQQSFQTIRLSLLLSPNNEKQVSETIRFREKKLQPQLYPLFYRNTSISSTISWSRCHKSGSSSLSIYLLITSMHPWYIPLLFPPSQDLWRVPWTGKWLVPVIASCPMALVGKGYVCTIASRLIIYGSLHRALVSMPKFRLCIFISAVLFQSLR